MESWHSLTIKETFKKLSASKDGLSGKEAKKRFHKFGPNKLPDPKRFTRLQIFLRQFKSPLIYLLVIAGAVSFFLHAAADSYIIFASVLLTVAFGYFQEQKAERTLEQLEKMVTHPALVVRDGESKKIEASYLVPGDTVILTSGDKIPADIRLTSCKSFEAQEAMLTGEAMPVKKSHEKVAPGAIVADRVSMAFMGTIVSRGRAKGIVVGTGLNTEFGKIAESLLKIKEEDTPFQKKVAHLSRWISLLLVVVVAIVFIGGILRGIEFAEIFTTSVAVAVAAIPESLVIAITVILAIGMLHLLQKKALVRKLISAETLGGTTVICADKTGTITEGRMKVAEIYTPQIQASGLATGQANNAGLFALEIAGIANEAYVGNPKEDTSKWKIHGDPTEKALIRAGIDNGLADLIIESEKYILDEMPFESENQYMATLMKHETRSMLVRRSLGEGGKHGSGNIIYYKGAPEKILDSSTYVYAPNRQAGQKKLSGSSHKRLEKIYEGFSHKGLRVLAVAYREVPEEIQIGKKNVKLKKLSQLENSLSGLTFVGFIALHDPIREKVAATIKTAQEAGIKVVMITGDHKYTAIAVAEELGLKVDRRNVIEGKDLAKMDEETLRKEVKKLTVYARILPHDKLRIVEAFQANGEVVAMTGDGVNDAPALKKADIGIAMGAGTDVAKEASDMIILDNNFRSIVRAVEQGRVIFDNLRKVVTYLLADSFTEIVLIGGSIIFADIIFDDAAIAAGAVLPVLAGQILWVNLVEDALPAFALAYEPKEKDIMKLPPLGRKAPILDAEMKVIIFIVGLVSDIILFGLFVWMFKATGNIDYARTMVFVALGTNSLLYIFSIKSLRRSIFRINLFDNKYLIGAVFFGFAMILAALYVPFLQNLLHTAPSVAGDWSIGMQEWAIIGLLGILEIVGIEIAKAIFILRRKR